MFKPDIPISKKEDDKLDRLPFCNQLAKAILNYRSSESLVIGLYGKWGSGKTSILNLTLNAVKLKKYKDNKPPKIINFNPWNFSGQDQLLSQFFREVAYQLNIDNGEKYKKVSKYLTKYSTFFATHAKNFSPPVIKSILDLFKNFSESIAQYYEYKANRFYYDLEGVRKQINEELYKLDERIIIVVDDIDRLNKKEIKQIFQLVKLLGDFKNTIYVLSFDKDVVVKALEEVQNASGETYLGKIVQVPFGIPEISIKLLHEFYSKSLDDVIINYPNEKIDTKYWAKIFHSGIKYFFKSLRDVKRFINIFKFKFDTLHEEVNIPDLIALTSIEVFLPEIYHEISYKKELLTGIFTKNTFLVEAGFDSGDNVERKKDFENIVSKAPDNLKDALEGLLKEMFPKFSEKHYGGESLGKWRKERRICSPEIFDSFFILNFSKDSISNSEMERIIFSAKDISEFESHIQNLIINKKAIQFLNFIHDYKDELKDDAIAQNILNVLMDLGDFFPENVNKSMLDYDTEMKLLQVFHTILSNFSIDKRYIMLKNAIEQSEHSLFVSIHEVAVMDQEQGKYNLSNESHHEKEYTINENDLIELEKLALNKIYKWKDNGNLLNHDKLSTILYYWKLWENESIVKQYIDESIRSDDEFVKFITKFLSFSTSYSDAGTKKNPQIHNDSINYYFEKDEAEKRIRRLLKEKKDLNESQKTALETYLENLNPNKRKF